MTRPRYPAAAATPGVDRRRRRLALGAAAAPLAAIAACGGGSGADHGPAEPDGMPGMAGMAGALPPLAPADAQRPLALLPLDDGLRDAQGVRQFALRVQRGSTRFRDGVDTATLGYNGALLGPALRLRSGEATRIAVRNALSEPTTVHWHGLVVPPQADGGPHQVIAPGDTWAAAFTVANPAGTCWFHPHGHGNTGRQVAGGLAGLLVVDDPALDPLALPHTWGVDDLALVLQDKRFDTAGRIDYTLSAADRLAGYGGDTLLANGVAGAWWQAPRQWVRLRLLNSCNARNLSLRIAPALPLLQIANEGGHLAQPVARASLMLAPGERAELLVDLGALALGQEASLLARSVDSGMGMGWLADEPEVGALNMRVALPRQAGAIAAPPARLAPAPGVVPPAGARQRTITLGGGMMGQPFTLDGRRFDPDRVDFVMAAGSTEIWHFANTTAMAHPMHVHGTWMSLLAGAGPAPATHEQGLRDTVLVGPMQAVPVAVRAAATASSTPLMLHCHLLEHEDAGMMAQFNTV